MSFIHNDNVDIKKSSKMIEGFIKNIKTSINRIDDINKNIDVEGKINVLLANVQQHRNDHNFKKTISLFVIKANMIISMFNNKEILDEYFKKDVYKKVYYPDKNQVVMYY